MTKYKEMLKLFVLKQSRMRKSVQSLQNFRDKNGNKI